MEFVLVQSMSDFKLEGSSVLLGLTRVIFTRKIFASLFERILVYQNVIVLVEMKSLEY